jgi:hypothetical protein
MALNAARLKASISEGCATIKSVMWPSRWMLNCSTTRPWNEKAASGTNQFRCTFWTKRRIHGPNSTPLVSNWMADPGSFAPPAGC